MSQSKKLVLFDFDGVLVNTFDSTFRISKIKNKDLTWERFKDFQNGNFHDNLQKDVKKNNFVIIDNFYDHYKKDLNDLTIEDILHEAITFLAKDNFLVIVSSTRSDIINDFLEKENLLSFFNETLGHEVHTSKVFKIKHALEKYGVSPSDTVFITDTLGDIKEANECDVPSIAVTWGLHKRENLQKGNPIAIIDNPQDLVTVVENVLK
ncbi:MAG: HAD family hydrolase [Patescibacteria group bacterium]|nr:HAD family hydrolase [Patescibacteria group bacterium]